MKFRYKHSSLLFKKKHNNRISFVLKQLRLNYRKQRNGNSLIKLYHNVKTTVTLLHKQRKPKT